MEHTSSRPSDRATQHEQPVAERTGYADSESRGLPGWVKVSAIVLAIFVLLVVSMMVLGGGQGLHMPRPH
jgi:hypothetical protein